MKRFLVLAILLLMVLAGVMVVSAQDTKGGDEAGSTFIIPLLNAGEPFAGTFEDHYTAQLYAFNGTTGDIVDITMVQDEDSTLDPYLILLGENGEALAYNDDDEKADIFLASGIYGYQLPYDGSYYIIATSWLELRETSYSADTPLDEPLNYTITASGFVIPEGMQAASPDETVPLNFNGTLIDANSEGTLTVTTETPVPYLGFIAQEGQHITVTTGSAGGTNDMSDPLVYLFDDAGRRLAVDDDTDGLYPSVEFDATYSGVYLLFVTGYNFQTIADDPESFTNVGDVLVTVSAQ
jgi:hypothetical protein